MQLDKFKGVINQQEETCHQVYLLSPWGVYLINCIKCVPRKTALSYTYYLTIFFVTLNKKYFKNHMI